MITRLVSMAALALFIGCATTAQTGGEKQEETAGLSPKKKQKRCVKELLTGSRLPVLVCEGDPNPHNLVQVEQQELRDRITRGGSPTQGQ